ncbi:MAG TPA: hypothetical protein VNW06_08050, partial [Cytophagaceae bacterium]|nr:hypothetical protein [Cytophagaceae bacterium]
MILLYNFLTDNPIASMYGPYFLVLYIFYIAAVYLIGYYYKTKFESNYNESIINIGNLPEPDPYLITFIRAGVSETTKLVVYNLFERGYLITNNQKIVKQKPGHPPVENLNKLEKLLFNHLRVSRSIENLVDYDEMLQETNRICKRSIDSSKYNELIYTETSLKEFKKIITRMRLAIGILGMYKLIAALSNGHGNVLFLILLMVLGIILSGYVIKPSRLTAAGKKYLADLQNIYSSKYSNGIKYASSNYKNLLAGIFGVSVFDELGYGYLINYEKKKNVTYNSNGSCASCSSSSGSSCSGGSSCGGGCGGG